MWIVVRASAVVRELFVGSFFSWVILLCWVIFVGSFFGSHSLGHSFVGVIRWVILWAFRAGVFVGFSLGCGRCFALFFLCGLFVSRDSK
jgi:hypothetical protein